MPKAKRRDRAVYQNQQRDDRFFEQDQNLIDFKQQTRKRTQVQIIPRNLNQESYVELLKNPNKHIVFAVGPAGTGKTMLAVQMAIKCFKEGSVKKIVITRPAVSVDEDHGFLPGTLNQKMEPWTRPIMDTFEEYYHPRDIKQMIEDNVIEIAPLAMMRGRTFKQSFIIADEVQNTTPSQMKMLLTRIGEGSRMAVTGDLQQADRPNENGLLEFHNLVKKYGETDMIGIAYFTAKDVERHPVVKEVLSIYREF